MGAFYEFVRSVVKRGQVALLVCLYCLHAGDGACVVLARIGRPREWPPVKERR